MKELKVALITLITLNIFWSIFIDKASLIDGVISNMISYPISILLIVFCEWNFNEYKFRNMINKDS